MWVSKCELAQVPSCSLGKKTSGFSAGELSKQFDMKFARCPILGIGRCQLQFLRRGGEQSEELGCVLGVIGAKPVP